ncbi:hypothetical protein [Microbispora hainanensis]|nr:hypothetical protein [Microbispora hainanensis]
MKTYSNILNHDRRLVSGVSTAPNYYFGKVLNDARWGRILAVTVSKR